MKILLIHQNYPGQFRHLGPELVRQGHEVRALTLRFDKPTRIEGVMVHPYRIPVKPGQGLHPFVQDWESKVLRGGACATAARGLRDAGFTPDVILGHYGWGETMFLKHVWPTARMGLYCELYYDPDHITNTFEDPITPSPDRYAQRIKLRLRNMLTRAHDDLMDAGLCPTAFQAGTFPAYFRDRISVIHDGVDTEAACPDPDVRFDLEDGRTLTRDDEVVTYVARSLEPMRGVHVMMRALPALLKARPNAQVLIVGREDVSYGAPSADGQSWKARMIAEVRPQITDDDWARVHFLGNIPYDRFLRFLQLSRVHIYLTHPFVLSWSLMEAMSCGACVVASEGPSVEEVVTDGQTGALVPFFGGDALVARVSALLDDPAERARLGQAARAQMVELYDLRSRSLPALVAWVNDLAAMTARQPVD